MTRLISETTDGQAERDTSIEVRLPGWYTRLIGLTVFAAAAALLVVAGQLQPSPEGFGTHQQLPMTAPCGFLVGTGYPCPSCGMTTAFAHTVRFHWLRAAWVQPMGFALALATVVVGIGGLWTLVFGRVPRTRWVPITPLQFFTGLLVGLVGAWAFVIVRGLASGTLPYTLGG